jgi:hypothetical protein
MAWDSASGGDDVQEVVEYFTEQTTAVELDVAGVAERVVYFPTPAFCSLLSKDTKEAVRSVCCAL